MNKNTKLFQNNINYHFKNEHLLLTALTHPSYLNENKLDRDSYQRLEFLGDAILEFITSNYLFKHLQNVREGRLTEIRAAIVRTENLAKCAHKISLGNYIFISKGEEINQGRKNEHILADVFEAILAAIYLDGSIHSAESFFDAFIKDELDQIIDQKLYIDAKTRLQEIIQAKFKVTPIYKLVQQAQNSNDNNLIEFTIGVYLNKECLATGVGKNKRLAEQQAAQNALLKLDQV